MTDFQFPINLQRTSCADKNDRLGWKGGFSLNLEGVSFGVRCNETAFLEELKGFFPPHQPGHQREVEVLLSFLKGGKTARKGVVNYHLVYDAWNRQARTQDLEEALNSFRTALHNRLALMAQENIYVQATVVKWREAGVVLLGASSEMVDALVQRGAELFSADYARIRPDLQLEDWQGRLLEPALVVAIRNASKRSLTRLSEGATALALASASPAMPYQAPRLLKAFAGFSQKVTGGQAVVNAPGDLAHLLSATKLLPVHA